MRRWRHVSASVLIALVTLGASLTQVAGIAQGDRPVFPGLIQLPAGFGPEGIAVGHGHRFYVGSFVPATRGQILVGDLRSGTFAELVPPTGRMAVGMKIDSSTNFLFVAGGTSGAATVCDADTGAQIALYQFQPAGVNGLNDVVVTRQAAYFTDTTRPFLYRVALEPDGQPGAADVIPLPANFGVRGGCTLDRRPEPTASLPRRMEST